MKRNTHRQVALRYPMARSNNAVPDTNAVSFDHVGHFIEHRHF